MNIETKSCEKLTDNIREKFQTKRPNSVLALMGFVITCQQIGVRGARMLLCLSDSQFYRLKADAQKLEQDYKCPRFRALSMIRAQLKEFIPLVSADIVQEDILPKSAGKQAGG
jgi:hypothetical protein